jgi:microcystin-dependent protein
MSQPYVGEIRMFGGSFAPAGWATCDGQILAISENDVLFNLIGTTYGGDGQSTFALPNLAARTPIHMGSNGTTNYSIAQNGGVTSVTLSTNQIPNHNHPIIADNNTATSGSPTNNYLAATPAGNLYTVPGSAPHPPLWQNLNPATLPVQGGSQPHDNMQPYQAITFIISLFGVFPSQT